MFTAPIKKILETLEVKNFQKSIEYSEFILARWDPIFRKILKFHVCFNKKCLSCRTVLNQRALCSPDLEECFTYPEHVHNSHKNFLEVLKATCFHKNIEYSEVILARWDAIFRKIQKFHVCFKKMSEPSHCPESTCAVFPWSRRMF